MADQMAVQMVDEHLVNQMAAQMVDEHLAKQATVQMIDERWASLFGTQAPGGRNERQEKRLVANALSKWIEVMGKHSTD